MTSRMEEESVVLSVGGAGESMGSIPPVAPCVGVAREIRGLSVDSVGGMGVIPGTPAGTPTRLPTAWVSFWSVEGGGALDDMLELVSWWIGVEAAAGSSDSEDEQEVRKFTVGSAWLEESLRV